MSITYTPVPPRREIFQVFAETLEELFQKNSRPVYLDADLMGSMKTSGLWESYPDRVFNCGIQEANMVGVACGMALNGFQPIIHSFTPFATRRVFDQLAVSVVYAGKSVRVVGSDAGICASWNGGTHMCFEDVAMLRSLPGVCLVDVSDGIMFADLLKQSVDWPGLTYFRTARRGRPDLYSNQDVFHKGKGKILAEGDDATIIASGIQVTEALKAAALLQQRGIGVRVVDVITVKPLDESLILESADKTGLLVVTENASIYGGLGEAVCGVVAAKRPVPVFRNGIRDRVGQTGSEEWLRQQYGICATDIVADVLHGLKKFK